MITAIHVQRLHARMQMVGVGGGEVHQEKNIGFLSNSGLNPLKNHKATKPAFIDRSSLQNASEKPFKWHFFAGGQMMALLIHVP